MILSKTCLSDGSLDKSAFIADDFRVVGDGSNVSRCQAENPSGNHKDSKAQRKMFGIGVVVQYLVALPTARQVGDLSRSDAFGRGYTFRLDF